MDNFLIFEFFCIFEILVSYRFSWLFSISPVCSTYSLFQFHLEESASYVQCTAGPAPA